ncbi:hypothetical protein [Salinithrix halophila]
MGKNAGSVTSWGSKVKRIFVTMFTGVLTFALMSSGVHAQTNQDPYGLVGNEKETREALLESGVDEADLDKLIAKLKRGEELDSMKSNKAIDVELGEGKTSKVTKFPDGSAIKLAKEPEVSGINPLGCWSGYCQYTEKVYVYSYPSNGSYYAKYTTVKGGYDEINSVWGGSTRSIGGSTENKVGPKISIKKESSSRWARAYMSWDWVAYSGVYSKNYTLRFFVGKNTCKESLVQ